MIPFDEWWKHVDQSRWLELNNLKIIIRSDFNRHCLNCIYGLFRTTPSPNFVYLNRIRLQRKDRSRLTPNRRRSQLLTSLKIGVEIVFIHKLSLSLFKYVNICPRRRGKGEIGEQKNWIETRKKKNNGKKRKQYAEQWEKWYAKNGRYIPDRWLIWKKKRQKYTIRRNIRKSGERKKESVLSALPEASCCHISFHGPWYTIESVS